MVVPTRDLPLDDYVSKLRKYAVITGRLSSPNSSGKRFAIIQATGEMNDTAISYAGRGNFPYVIGAKYEAPPATERVGNQPPEVIQAGVIKGKKAVICAIEGATMTIGFWMGFDQDGGRVLNSPHAAGGRALDEMLTNVRQYGGRPDDRFARYTLAANGSGFVIRDMTAIWDDCTSLIFDPINGRVTAIRNSHSPQMPARSNDGVFEYGISAFSMEFKRRGGVVVSTLREERISGSPSEFSAKVKLSPEEVTALSATVRSNNRWVDLASQRVVHYSQSSAQASGN